MLSKTAPQNRPPPRRLVSLRHHLLAYRIAEMLGEGQDAVAAHWWAAAPPPCRPASAPAPPPHWPASQPASCCRRRPSLQKQAQSQNQAVQASLPKFRRACAKISASPSVPDAALRDALLARLRGVPGVHYAPIAVHAQARPRGGGGGFKGFRVDRVKALRV
jgi:hypothetical protein